MSVKKILFKANKQVFGSMIGSHVSLFQGEGFEFTQLREYVYGDDVRKIDWKTTAKLGKPFVKIYNEERELNVVTALMIGGSCYFGTSRAKSEVMSELVALIGLSARKHGDRFSSMIFADRLHHYTKPSKKIFAIREAIGHVECFDMLGKESNYHTFFERLYSGIKRRSLIFIISDFVGDIDLTLLSKKHDIVALIIRDKFEENPQALGLVHLLDMEVALSFEGDFEEASLANYQMEFKKHDEQLHAHLKKNAIRYSKIYTDDEVYLKLMKLFGRQQ